MAIDLSQIEALGVDPIPGDSPGGENVQGGDEFDYISRGFRSLTSLAHGTEGDVRPQGEEEPTWPDIAERSIALLRDKGKHMQVVTFLAIALFHEQGMPGLSAGMKLAHNVMKNFWETMYPPLKRVKGRKSALQFLGEHVAGDTPEHEGGQMALQARGKLTEFKELMKKNPTASEKVNALESIQKQQDGLKEMKEVLAAIKTQIYDLFPDDHIPSLGTLNAAVDRLVLEFKQEIDKNKPKEEKPAAAPGQPGDGPAAAPRPAAPSAGSQAAVPDVSAGSAKEVFKALQKLAPILHEADPTDPAGYRLARMGAWGGIAAAPPAAEGNKTLVPPGPVNTQRIQYLQSVFETGNWFKLLGDVEPNFRDAPLWLDQQFYVWKALKGQGGSFAAAAEAVVQETRALLDRAPSLPGLTFSDATPFAGPMTQQWIDEEVMAESGGGGGARAGGGGGNGSEGLDEAIGQAKALAGEGKLADAIRVLQAGPGRSNSRRQSFLWQTALARLIQDAGKTKLTQPIWEELLEEIDRFRLEAWEPEITIPVLHSLYRTLKADKDSADKAAEVFARICRTDLSAALGLEKG